MTPQIVFRSQSVLAKQQAATNQKLRFAEVAGGTTAECAAVCCCCPCGLVNLLVLAMYKLPAGLCRKALKKKKEQSVKKGLLPRKRMSTCGCKETDTHVHVQPVSVDLRPLDTSDKEDSTAKEVLELEKEMWDRFYSSSF
ncbi:hypothetical protein NE237_008770 [Protea cynaroides]|uniref:Uncharacterized protein n=1 Tax=Protea cynaroides TaxID=273540 RepID=A0A9Q0KWG3_9MAGN|nr:hypothetical protein NE237_008770 [Protea cynaroides]